MRTQSGVVATAMALKPIKMQLVAQTQCRKFVCAPRPGVTHRKKFKTPPRFQSRQIKKGIQAFS
jgi:hypothetical protein